LKVFQSLRPNGHLKEETCYPDTETNLVKFGLVLVIQRRASALLLESTSSGFGVNSFSFRRAAGSSAFPRGWNLQTLTYSGCQTIQGFLSVTILGAMLIDTYRYELAEPLAEQGALLRRSGG
tara:strand:+ start:8330 stop:8695 length:366 start_codon:yes stop_codon:yes gene_type:complete